ncbi:MAG TPA: HRDC domain-containing protein, partial [Pirellulales bacterium]|nr:HRDC domain-containing protein [Pirellulales bacterium]
IVYASTRKRCEELSQRITGRTRRPTSVYHAGLPVHERRVAQDDFMQGRTEIAVATLAFGMGIDKADVRFVVHYNLPGSLEAYYQEAGRAGRDGHAAQCLLLFGGADRKIHEFFIECAYPSRDVVEQVYEFLCGLEQNPIEMTQQEVKEELGLQIGAEGVGACEKLLEAAGVLERLETGENAAAIRLSSDLPTLVDLLPQQAKAKRQLIRALERLVGAKRYEWCYFQPRELLRELTDFDSTSLARNLRELASLAAVDYVPPFRGRAIHLRTGNLPFKDLEIDFKTLEEHKAAEYERLERMVRFGKSFTCRQQQILKYFGEANPQPCQHCDNCQNGESSTGDGETTRAASPRVVEAVRIVLSGVARVRRGCGKQLLAQMLCGSKSKKVERNRLDKLSTFGLLAHLTQSEVVVLIEAMLRARLLEENEIEPFRPVLQLTPRGAEVMGGHGGQSPRLELPDSLWTRIDPLVEGGEPRQTARPEAPVNPNLVARLRQWRERTAKAQNLPAYIVMTNALLDDLARACPQSPAELLNIKGMGPNKVREYGQELLGMLAGGEAQTREPREGSPAASEEPAAPALGDELTASAPQTSGDRCG